MRWERLPAASYLKIYVAVRNVTAGYSYSYLKLTAFLHVST